MDDEEKQKQKTQHQKQSKTLQQMPQKRKGM